MATLTKADIAATLARTAAMQQNRARKLIDGFFEEIRQQLAAGNDIKLSGFGNFELRNKGARPGRNPKTGKLVTITPRRVVTFKVGQKLKREVRS